MKRKAKRQSVRIIYRAFGETVKGLFDTERATVRIGTESYSLTAGCKVARREMKLKETSENGWVRWFTVADITVKGRKIKGGSPLSVIRDLIGRPATSRVTVKPDKPVDKPKATRKPAKARRRKATKRTPDKATRKPAKRTSRKPAVKVTRKANK